jgi:uncharacterized protein
MDKRLLELLVCPVTKGPLIWQPPLVEADTGTPSHEGELISLSARLAYSIKDGIPVMMESEARVLKEDEYNTLRAKNPPRV